MKALLRSRFTWLSVLVTVALCAAVALAALIDEDTKVEDLYNYDLHKALATQQATTLRDLADTFVLDQYLYLWITPPAEDFILLQPGGTIPILDTTGFPDSFIDGLAGVEEGGIRKFPVWVYEDADSPGREIVIETVLEGKQIARISREWDYSPQWFVRDRYPDLDSYDKAYRDSLVAGYDPARVCMRYDLLVGEDDLIKYVWVQSIAAAQAEEVGGGMMKSSWSGSVTNLQFVEIYKTNNCQAVVLAYPDSYKTNSSTAFEIFTCDGGEGLIDFWWDLGTVTNVDTSTNYVEWIDTESSNAYAKVRFYAAAVSNDVDGDGFTDGYEKYVSHTVVTNSNSYPVVVSGTLSYSGPQDGLLWMVAVTNSSDWFGSPVSVESPGVYSNSTVAVGASYWFKAFRDSNGNTRREAWEAQGTYSSGSTYVSGDQTSINITLTDPDDDSDQLPDWWEMLYFGDLDETATSDFESDGLNNLSEYLIGTNPNDADSDGDLMGDGTEIARGEDPTVPPTGYTQHMSLAFVEQFETNTVSTGDLNGKNRWVSSPAGRVVVQTNDTYAGAQAIEFAAGSGVAEAEHLVGATGQQTVWIDLYAKVDNTTIPPGDHPVIQTAPKQIASVFAMNADGDVYAYAGPANGWTNVTASPLTNNVYHRYTVKQDYSTKTWDFYIDSSLVSSGLGFRDPDTCEFSLFSATGTRGDGTYCDDVNISTNKPAGIP